MAASRRRPLLTRLGQKVMELDNYGEAASFNIAGKSSYPSVYGTLISILILAVVIPYGTNKFIVMRNYEDTNFMSITLESGTSVDEEFGHDQTNLNVMFFFSTLYNEYFTKEDLEGYLQIEAYIVIQPNFDLEMIELVQCTKSDLDNNFYPASDWLYEQLDYLFCIKKPEDIKLLGNINAEEFKLLNIAVERCSSETAACKSEDEIDHFIDQLFLYAYFNDQKYSPQLIGETPIINYLKEEIFMLSSKETGKTIELITQFNEIEAEDDLLGLGYSFNKANYSFSSLNKKNEFFDIEGSLLRLAFGIDPSIVSY